MITPDNIEPIPFLIIMALIVAWWLALGIRDRRRARRLRRALTDADGCALIWAEGDTWCVCTRPHEHTGPHMDNVHRVIRR